MIVLWCPTAVRAPLGLDGCGPMLGGPPRAVHHTTEGGTVAGAEATYRQTHNFPHLTVDYVADVVHQHLGVDVGATALQNASGGVQTNRQGSVCVQIEWVGRAVEPFTGKREHAGPNVLGLLDWLRGLGIPDVWPEGPPPPYPASYGADNGERHPAVWTAQAGHYGHSQVPENHHGDPGAIDPHFVTQTAHVTAQAATPVTPLEEDDMHLLVDDPGSSAWWVVRADLSLKVLVQDNIALDALKKSGRYVQVALGKRQLAAIPTAKA